MVTIIRGGLDRKAVAPPPKLWVELGLSRRRGAHISNNFPCFVFSVEFHTFLSRAAIGVSISEDLAGAWRMLGDALSALPEQAGMTCSP